MSDIVSMKIYSAFRLKDFFGGWKGGLVEKTEIYYKALRGHTCPPEIKKDYFTGKTSDGPQNRL